MDYRDYLIRQHQQERMAQQWGEWGASVIDNILGAPADKYLSATEDRVMRFFEGAFSDPNNWESNPQPDPAPAIESYTASSLDHHDVLPEEIVDAEIVEPEGEPARRHAAADRGGDQSWRVRPEGGK
jgi:hypothetical protein